MGVLTVNIEDQSTEKSVRAFLDKLDLKYSIDNQEAVYKWWEDEALADELGRRSDDLKSGRDKGISFAEFKNNLLKR